MFRFNVILFYLILSTSGLYGFQTQAVWKKQDRCLTAIGGIEVKPLSLNVDDVTLWQAHESEVPDDNPRILFYKDGVHYLIYPSCLSEIQTFDLNTEQWRDVDSDKGRKFVFDLYADFEKQFGCKWRDRLFMFKKPAEQIQPSMTVRQRFAARRAEELQGGTTSAHRQQGEDAFGCPLTLTPEDSSDDEGLSWQEELKHKGTKVLDFILTGICAELDDLKIYKVEGTNSSFFVRRDSKNAIVLKNGKEVFVLGHNGFTWEKSADVENDHRSNVLQNIQDIFNRAVRYNQHLRQVDHDRYCQKVRHREMDEDDARSNQDFLDRYWRSVSNRTPQKCTDENNDSRMIVDGSSMKALRIQQQMEGSCMDIDCPHQPANTFEKVDNLRIYNFLKMLRDCGHEKIACSD